MSESNARLLDDILEYIFQWKPAKKRASLQDGFLSQLRSRIFRLQHTRSVSEHNDEQNCIVLHALEKLISSKSHFRNRQSESFPKLRSIQALYQECENTQRSREKSSPVRLTRCRTKQMLALAVLSDAASSIPQMSDDAIAAEFASLEQLPSRKASTVSNAHARTLHAALVKHWRCVCKTCREAYIGLNQSEPGTDTCDVSFDMIFGFGDPSSKVLQEGRVIVSDKPQHRIRLHNPEAGNPAKSNGMCTIIQTSVEEDCRFCIQLSHDGISQLDPCDKDFDTSQHPQSIPLTSLFSEHGSPDRRDPMLPLRGRRILAAVVARALGPLLVTPWLEAGQMPARIHFFRPMRRGKSPSITRPFLMTAGDAGAADPSSTAAATAGRPKCLHPVPGILALGIMLCELHYCTPISFWRQPRHLSNGNLTPNTDHHTAWDVWELMQRAIEHVGVQYAKAIENCLTWKREFSDFNTLAAQDEYHAKVVRPLENEAGHYAGIPLDELGGLTQEVERQLWGDRGLSVFEVAETRDPGGPSRGAVDLFSPAPNPLRTTGLDGLNRGSYIGFNQGPIINNIYHGSRAFDETRSSAA